MPPAGGWIGEDEAAASAERNPRRIRAARRQRRRPKGKQSQRPRAGIRRHVRSKRPGVRLAAFCLVRRAARVDRGRACGTPAPAVWPGRSFGRLSPRLTDRRERTYTTGGVLCSLPVGTAAGGRART
jgi:hypothetical protein